MEELFIKIGKCVESSDVIFKNLPDVLEIHMFVEENPSFYNT